MSSKMDTDVLLKLCHRLSLNSSFLLLICLKATFLVHLWLTNFKSVYVMCSCASSRDLDGKGQQCSPCKCRNTCPVSTCSCVSLQPVAGIPGRQYIMSKSCLNLVFLALQCVIILQRYIFVRCRSKCNFHIHHSLCDFGVWLSDGPRMSFWSAGPHATILYLHFCLRSTSFAIAFYTVVYLLQKLVQLLCLYPFCYHWFHK